jgi:2'-hydroxyisoflavone reductase
MKTLVVGGTGFLGGAMTEAARAAGHTVTVLTRGQKERALPPGVEALHADRHGNLDALAGRQFDLVIDTCAYAPDAVARLLDALQSRIGRYAFVSSISAYGTFSPGMDETAPTPRATPEQLAMAQAMPPEQRSSGAAYGLAYGPLKRECEIVAEERLGDRALLLRAGLLVGAGDYTDRLTFWVRRIDEGGLVACPGDPARPAQFVDVRDVARWTILAAERGLGGAFNVTGRALPMSAFFEACRRVAGSDAAFRWIPEEQVIAAGLSPWIQVPLWFPRSSPVYHLLDVAVDRVFAHGFETRPVEDTLRQILDWDRGRRDTPLKAGFTWGKEAALLASKAPPA